MPGKRSGGRDAAGSGGGACSTASFVSFNEHQKNRNLLLANVAAAGKRKIGLWQIQLIQLKKSAKGAKAGLATQMEIGARWS